MRFGGLRDTATRLRSNGADLRSESVVQDSNSAGKRMSIYHELKERQRNGREVSRVSPA